MSSFLLGRNSAAITVLSFNLIMLRCRTPNTFVSLFLLVLWEGFSWNMKVKDTGVFTGEEFANPYAHTKKLFTILFLLQTF